MSKKSAYIITKPLQYINATNIPDTNKKDCFLIDCFLGFTQFKDSIEQNSNYWKEIQAYKTSLNALYYIFLHKNRYNKIFIDSDYGIYKTFIFLFLSPLKIYTYEEGYGSYRILKEAIRFGDKVYRFFGGNSWIGSNPFTVGIFLYYPDIFKKYITGNKKEVYKFKRSLYDNLKLLPEINSLLKDLDLNIYANKDVLIYLSSWNLNEKIYECLDDYPNYIKILKPHPHLVQLDNPLVSKFDFIVDNIIPSEIILTKLIDICKDIVVVHENSSSVLYIGNMNYTDINISIKKTKNDVISNLFEDIKNELA